MAARVRRRRHARLLGAALMIGAGLVAVFLAVNAERRSLEDVARPLTARQRPADVAAAPARAP